MPPMEELFSLLGEPQSPFPKRPLAVVEEQISTALPSDYRAWAGRYASIEFGNAVSIVNLACVEHDVRREVAEALAAQRHGIRVLGAERVYDAAGQPQDFECRLDRFYLEMLGLFWWGLGRGRVRARVVHRGRADEWKTVVTDEAGDLHLIDCGFAELVLRLIRNDLGPRLDAGAWFERRIIGELWGYKTVTVAGREYQAADFRPIGELPPVETT